MQEQPASPQPTVTPETYPGKGIGIAGFVLAFTGTQLIGLILSIIGYRKAKEAGVKHTLALAGIILNSIFIGLALLIIPLIVATTIVNYNNITLRANTSSAESSASSVQKYAQIYYSQNNTYPTTVKDVDGAIAEFSLTELTEAPSSPEVVALYTCGDDGNKIAYWDYTDSIVKYRYTGTAIESGNCTLAK